MQKMDITVFNLKVYYTCTYNNNEEYIIFNII